MPTLFADAGYWIALLHPDDQLHARATAMTATLGAGTIVTTQMALAEALNHLAAKGRGLRRLAAEMVRELEARPDVEIVPQSNTQFRTALERYAARTDQTWSLTDCASFLVMEERNITEALAFDRDFEQAGFVALLRERQG